MPLQLFRLDERVEPTSPQFQRIVDEAKGMIPRYCPEWTDHNVSDPGVALIELFAWMTETLLYRVNQIPDRMYVRFLELLGMRLQPPRAAHAPVTFYLAAPLTGSHAYQVANNVRAETTVSVPETSTATIDAGTEVATLRTETIEPVVFTVKSSLTLRPPEIQEHRAYVQSSRGWQAYDLRQLASGRAIPLFGEPPTPDDAFYLPLAHDCSEYVLALALACQEARPENLRPAWPPRVFEASIGEGAWAECIIEVDQTRGFTEPHGDIILRVPAMARAEYQGRAAYWLRCRYHGQSDNNKYGRSPVIKGLRIESRGVTATAYHETVAEAELLGLSDGTPGQRFTLRHSPILERDPDHHYMVVITPDGEKQRWHEVAHFGDSHEDRHYTLDSASGALTFAPWLLQPDGRFYRLGQVPPKGSRLVFLQYRYGGGRVEVGVEAIGVLKTSNPYIRRIINWKAAEGGLDLQRLEDAVLRSVPRYLRTRERAVTAADYEYLACQIEGVARARCLAPGAQPGIPGEPKPGHVILSVLPVRSRTPSASVPENVDALGLSEELQQAVENVLHERQVLGTRLSVQLPVYVRVTVVARLRVTRGSHPSLVFDVRRAAEAALYLYVDPFTGGPQASGWPFGRELYRRELVALLERLPDVESVDEVNIQSEVAGKSGSTPTAGGGSVRIPPNGLIVSGHHQVTVEREV